jgi:hypothetical protein
MANVCTIIVEKPVWSTAVGVIGVNLLIVREHVVVALGKDFAHVTIQCKNTFFNLFYSILKSN